MVKSLSDHEAWFVQYVNSVRAKETEDPEPLDMKQKHTLCVLENAKAIVTQEGFEPKMARACLLAALYHDLGRFEQYRRYRTFKDRVSIDHGNFGVEIIKKTQCLQGEERWTEDVVMAAVGLHNKYILPNDLPKDTQTVTFVVRDADKLDILRVIDEHLSHKPYNQTVMLQLPDDPDLFSETVIKAALEDKVSAYGDLKSVNDFRLLLSTWIYDMNFSESRQQFIDQGHALKILADLPENGVYAKAKAHMLTKLQK
ncbi:MAG: HD domain-containing protein [Desulfovibrio sp.]|nr:HD domain-containing protein [Desulfovibrio sp.]